MGAREGRGERRPSSTPVLYDLADGLRAVAVALSPYLPETAPRILDALRQPLDLSLDRVRPQAAERGRRDRAGPAALPARRRAAAARDRHARAPRRVRRRRRRGSSRARARRGRQRGSSRSARRSRPAARALALAERARRRLRGPRHPSARGGRRRATGSASCATLLAHPSAVAVGETGLDYYRDYAPRDAQRRLFEAQLELAAELGKPVVIHTRAADDDTLAVARAASTARSSCTASRRRAPAGRARARLLRLVRRQRHLPEGRRSCALAATPGPGRPHPRRDRQPVPRAAAGPRPAERAGERRSTRSPRSPRRAARTRPSSRRRSTRTPPPLLGCRERRGRRRSSASTSSSTRTSSA